jgi:hypothetical protein
LHPAPPLAHHRKVRRVATDRRCVAPASVHEMAAETNELEQIADRYARFAADEARGVSDTYERLARAVTVSAELLEFLATLPPDRRQPNLFLAAVRHPFGVPGSAEGLVEIVRREQGRIRHLMLSRTTQTNEPARCAVLLPLLARLPQPLALLEVGASAGLCLFPDRYGYDYGGVRLEPRNGSARPPPVFECLAGGAVPVPPDLPTIAWRRGIDLAPIDIGSEAETAWLETLVWPGQEARAERLRAAIDVARAEPPQIVRGDLLTADLAAVMAEAPVHATPVVFHSAVLGYVASRVDRERFASRMRRSGAVWISNELPGVFPDIAKAAPAPPRPGLFLLALDGRPLAWTGPHGQSIAWFGS